MFLMHVVCYLCILYHSFWYCRFSPNHMVFPTSYLILVISLYFTLGGGVQEAPKKNFGSNPLWKLVVGWIVRFIWCHIPIDNQLFIACVYIYIVTMLYTFQFFRIVPHNYFDCDWVSASFCPSTKLGRILSFCQP